MVPPQTRSAADLELLISAIPASSAVVSKFPESVLPSVQTGGRRRILLGANPFVRQAPIGPDRDDRISRQSIGVIRAGRSTKEESSARRVRR
jgi:hypothetical protein